MTRPRPSYTPKPRIWDQIQVTARFGKGGNWFSTIRSELEKQGFPLYDNFLGGWDADAIDLWLDRRSGIAESNILDADKELDKWEKSGCHIS